VIVGSYFPQKPGAVFGNVGMNWKIKQGPSFNLGFKIDKQTKTSSGLQPGVQNKLRNANEPASSRLSIPDTIVFLSKNSR
jgi:hypothetical protein